MEFLKTSTQFSHLGYPLIVFYLVALVGFVLVIFRQHWALLFSLFCLASLNFHAAVFTRTLFFGPYLNLNDLLLWIALFAMLGECLRTRKRIWAPKILLAIFVLIIIGDLQSIIKYGFIENVLRRIWSTAIFPIMFLIAANVVYNTKRARLFYWALFSGVTIAAVSHMIYVYSIIDYQANILYSQIRTISYSINCGAPILIGSIFVLLNLKLCHWKKSLYYIGLSLIGLSLVLNFSRGLWFTSALAFISLPFLIREQKSISRVPIKLGLLVGGTAIIVSLFFPNLHIGGMMFERVQSVRSEEGFLKAYKSRSEGANTEMDIWWDGSLILGAGSSLPYQVIRRSEYEELGALGHVAYSTYLAHYGLVGLIIYLILLNFLTIWVGRNYYFKHFNDYADGIAVIGITCAVINLTGFFSSVHYLGSTTHIVGLLYGAVWGLQRARILKVNRHSTYEITKSVSNFTREYDD